MCLLINRIGSYLIQNCEATFGQVAAVRICWIKSIIFLHSIACYFQILLSFLIGQYEYKLTPFRPACY